MNTPEEIKNGLKICRGECTGNKPHCPYDKYVNGCEDTLNRDALAYIQQLEAAQPKWVSAANPPEKWHMDDEDNALINYLVVVHDYGVDIGNYVKPANMWVVMGLPAKVTHWMTLPEPPKED